MANEEQEQEGKKSSERDGPRQKGAFVLIGTGLAWVSAIGLVLIMLLGVSDVLLRVVLQSPLLGTYEITQYLMVFVVFGALTYTAVHDGHVTIDWITLFLPKRTQAIVDSVAYLLGILLFAAVAWQSAVQGYEMLSKHQTSFTLGIPIYPFLWVVALGSIALDLILLSKLRDSLRNWR
jgi:TRAP-type C4-dicarboxylate transport system permease small subunit